MQFPFLNLGALHASIAEELNQALGRVVQSSAFINGPDVKTFEYKWGDFCGTKHAIGAANGTAALHAVLHGMGIGLHDEVIIPSHTFVATAESVRLTGAKPVFAEILPDTMLLDPASVEHAITPKTKAIVAVHLYGMPCDMDVLNEIGRQRGVLVVEDAAQAHGARYKGRMAGSLGHAAAFSFFPGKNLGAIGDAGGITTSDERLAEKVRLYVDHGRKSKYEHLVMGTNYRLDTLQAAVLTTKLRHLRAWNARRAEVAARYRDRLSREPFASFPIRLQAPTPGAESANHLFVIRLPYRDQVMEALNKRGVATGIHYPIPCHMQPSMRDVSPGPGALITTERIAATVLSLPMCPTMTPDQADQICDLLTMAVMDVKSTTGTWTSTWMPVKK